MLVQWNIWARSMERRIMERSMILPHYVDYNHIRTIYVTPGLIFSQKQENDVFLFCSLQGRIFYCL